MVTDKVTYWLDIVDNDLTVAEDLYKMGHGCTVRSCAIRSSKRCSRHTGQPLAMMTLHTPTAISGFWRCVD